MKMKQEGLVYTYCTANHIELAVLNSIKYDPYLQDFSKQTEILQDEFKQLGRLQIFGSVASQARALTLLDKTLRYQFLIWKIKTMVKIKLQNKQTGT